ncbi:MAG: hypothetical protein IIZ40_01290 [Bacilli bacterium]|nr:hypothetical protein [Bacilli bacterium]
MKLYLGKEQVDISKEDMDNNYLGDEVCGMEGKVYIYKKEVLKIYNDYLKYRHKLTLDEVNKMSFVDTKRILLPKRAIFDKDLNFIGYTTTFKIEAPKERIGTIKVSDLISDLELIKEDLKTISDNKIKLDDLNSGSLLMTQEGIFIGDPGAYRISPNSDIDNLYKYNLNEMNYFFTRIIFDNYLKITKKEKEKLKEYFDLREEFLTEKIQKDIVNQKSSVNNAFKKILH